MAVVNKCVYRHRRLDTNEVFYVGIGNLKRPYNTYHRSNFWKKIINKTKYKVEILAKNLSVEKAIDLEKLLISEYGRLNLKTGTLCNLTDGGDGLVNSIRTKEWINKISKSLTGRKLSKSHKQKLSNAKKGTIGNNQTNYKLDNRKKVINMITKKVYSSAKEASGYSNFSYSAFRAQLNGQNKNKTQFKYLEDAG